MPCGSTRQFLTSLFVVSSNRHFRSARHLPSHPAGSLNIDAASAGTTPRCAFMESIFATKAYRGPIILSILSRMNSLLLDASQDGRT